MRLCIADFDMSLRGRYTVLMEHDSDVDDLLRENLRLSQENNRLLRKIRRAGQLQTWGTVLFYIVIVGVPVFVYRYYLADYVTEVKSLYQMILDDTATLKKLPASLPSAVSERIESVRGVFE